MAITLKGLTGNVTVTVGESSLEFLDYGSTSNISTETFSAEARNTQVLSDPNDPDSVTIVSQPSRGHVAARPDGKISLNLNEEDATTNISFVYDRVVGATTTRVTATVSVSPAVKRGWGIGGYFGQEVDPATDELVVEPGESTRKVHISATGLDAAGVAALEVGYSNISAGSVNASWLYANKAQGGDDYYGETEALALNKALGEGLATTLDGELHSSPHILYKRGDVFSSGLGAGNDGVGESRLHPTLIGSYGSGDVPYFQGDGVNGGTYYAYVLYQNLAWGNSGQFRIGDFFGVDGIYTDMAFRDNSNHKPIYIDGVSHSYEGAIIRRFVSLDASRTDPADGLYWSLGTTDAMSCFYSSGGNGLMVEKFFGDHADWEAGYRADRSGAFPKSPDTRGHGTYLAIEHTDVTINGFIGTRNSHSAIQFRPAGVLMNVFTAGNNTGINPSNALNDPDYGDFGNRTLIYRYGQTDGGFKDVWDGLAVLAGGLVIGNPAVSIVDSFIMNAGSYELFTSSTDIGPKVKSAPGSSSFFPKRFDGAGATVRDELIVSNWNRSNYSDTNVGAVSEVERDALTIGAHTDTWLETTGSDLDDYAVALRAEAAPWDQVNPTLDSFLSPFGKSLSSRAVAQTVTFQPDATGGTPGIRADIPLDWDTGDLPGAVAGDSIHLSGHKVYWSMTPANWIDDLTFGPRGGLTMLVGALRPQGEVVVASSGNALNVWNGAKFDLPNHASSNLLTVDAREGRFLNAGAMTGKINVSARYRSELLFGFGAASWTTVSGTAINLYGKAKAGFDGTGGASAGLTLSSGSTLRFLPSVAITVSGITIGEGDILPKAAIAPRVGAVVTGLTSGATGVVTYARRIGTASYALELEDLTGVFLNTEALQADCWFGVGFYGSDVTFGAVNGSPVHTMPKIREFACGVNGYKVAPDVVSTVVLASGSAVEIGTTGLAAGTYDLIDVDSLTDNGATLPSGVAKVGNKLVLTVS